MKEVYTLLLSLGAVTEMPRKIANAPNLTPTPRWTEQDSWRMKRSNYRRTYLGYNPLHMDFASNVRCCLLIIPIMWHSIWSTRVRKMMCNQLITYIKTGIH